MIKKNNNKKMIKFQFFFSIITIQVHLDLSNLKFFKKMICLMNCKIKIKQKKVFMKLI